MVPSPRNDHRLTRHLLARRMETLAAGSPLSSVPAMAALAVLIGANGASPWLWAWAATLAVVVVARNLTLWRWQTPGPGPATNARRWRSINLWLAAESLLWAGGLPLAALLPPAAGLAMVAAVALIVLSSVLLNHWAAPGAGLFHIGCVAAGLALAERIAGGTGPLLVLTGLYAATLAGALVQRERAFRRGGRSELERLNSAQAILEVLHDHETQMDERDTLDPPPVEERVRTIALVDPLTGLANRHAFTSRLRVLLGGADMKPMALFCLDLDDFKTVNDVQGLPFADELLREMGARLRDEAREGDLVARLGGDEFAILVFAPGGDGMLIERAHRLLAAAREPFAIDGQTARLSTSIGIARAEAGQDVAEILRRADLALYAAKAKGRDQMALFDPLHDRLARERCALELELRGALGRGEMVLHYQPIVALQSGATVGYEALLRWRHSERGLLLPDEFLSVAEETGLIVDLGDWVVRQALADIAGWPGDFRLALNFSPTQLRNPHLIATIDRALAASGIAPSRLEIEITEHVLFDDAGAGSAIIARLRSLGVQIALDDFGTGYSSLSYLRRFRFDRVKIDRTFVRDIESSDEAQAIVSAVTRLAQALGMRTTAEGLERPEQLDLLRKLGCDEAQGFLILEPVEAERIEQSRFRGEDLPAIAEELDDYRKARRSALAGATVRRG